MRIMTVFDPANASMEIWFGRNLDLTMTRDIFRTYERVTSRVSLCVLDLRRVERVFDSGLGLVLMLCRRLKAVGAQILVVGDVPEVKRIVDAQFGTPGLAGYSTKGDTVDFTSTHAKANDAPRELARDYEHPVSLDARSLGAVIT